MKNWELKQTKQCKKCPWKVSTNPMDIPNGYSVERHEALKSAIADPNKNYGLGSLNIMACHETDDAHCIGWLYNQLGRGNNIALRLRMMTCSNFQDTRTVGKQHHYFEQTLPDSDCDWDDEYED